MGKREEKFDLDADVGKPGWQKRRSDYCAQLGGTLADPDKDGRVSMTEQSHKDSCDINVMMKRYQSLPPVPVDQNGQPFFGDFAGIENVREMQQALLDAQNGFMALSADVRNRFMNDPVKLLEFLDQRHSDPKIMEEAIKLGLVNAPVPEASPAKVEVVNLPQPAPKGEKAKSE